MKHICNLAVGLLAAVMLWQTAPAAGLNYSFQQINVPGSAHTATLGVNDHGDVVGVYDTGGFPSGFLLRGGVFTTLTVPGSILTTAHGINNRGDIVGDFIDAGFNEHAFLLRKGQFTVIDFPGAIATDRPAINDRGDIVGAYFTADNPDVAHGFLLTPDGTFQAIAYPGAVESGADAINAQGDMVGVWDNDIFFNFHGFVLSQGVFTVLDYPGAAGELGGSSPTGINARGQVSGVFVDSDGGSHGYVWDSGVFAQVDVPAGLPGTTAVFGLNDVGQLVGNYFDPVLGQRVGFIATPQQK
jgi:probable HAF family extracellular repeat protein